MVTERQARIDELPYLQQRINESDNEKVRLYAELEGGIVPLSMVWVTEKDGKITGMINLRLMWQAEPLYVFPEVKDKNERRRIAIMLPRAMERWLGDRAQNKTGIYSYFFVTMSRAWAKLAIHFGCTRIYTRHITLGKDL
jgi:hypothetical protein